MGKRTDFARRERDEYPTPLPAAVSLLRLLKPGNKFVEPCAGDGELVGHLKRAGHVCIGAYDLPIDARIARYAIESDALFITNPPWRRQFGMTEIIANLSDQRPLWALLYSDWLFTLNATAYLPRLRAIAVVGRVRWIPGTKYSGYENSCWCLFDQPRPEALAEIRFHGHTGARAPLCLGASS